jgi:hypothetical protein
MMRRLNLRILIWVIWKTIPVRKIRCKKNKDNKDVKVIVKTDPPILGKIVNLAKGLILRGKCFG